MLRKQFCVNGEWKDSKTERWMPVSDSSTGEVIAEVPCCTVEEVEEAIASAASAFPAWSQTSISQRTQMMFKWRNILMDHLEELRAVRQGTGQKPLRGPGRHSEDHRADGAGLRCTVHHPGLRFPAGYNRL